MYKRNQLWAFLTTLVVLTMLVAACGPTPMLRAVALLCRDLPGAVVRLSLEERMSCAIGACMGCVVKTVRGYERVCYDGPVFDARDLIL